MQPPKHISVCTLGWRIRWWINWRIRWRIAWRNDWRNIIRLNLHASSPASSAAPASPSPSSPASRSGRCSRGCCILCCTLRHGLIFIYIVPLRPAGGTATASFLKFNSSFIQKIVEIMTVKLYNINNQAYKSRHIV